MELRHIRYFIALAEELHFGRAAQRLNITQPPLSRQIKQLEEELGTKLFERNHRQVRLTEAGEVFLNRAKRILEDTEQLIRDTQRVARGEQGQISIGFVVSASYELVPTVLREFKSKYRDVDIRLHEMTTLEQIDALQMEKINVGFLRPPVGVASVVSRQVVEFHRVPLLRELRHLCRTEVGASNAWLPVTLAIDSRLK